MSQNQNMGWGYVAGFLDADGGVYLDRVRGQVRVEWSQAPPQDFVLNCIQQFLDANGIPSRLNSHKTKGRMHFTLGIYRCNDAIKTLEALLPFLIVKKGKAEEALEFLKGKNALKDGVGWFGTRTHCKRGHLWKRDGTVNSRGQRVCLACQRARMKKYRLARAKS